MPEDHIDAVRRSLDAWNRGDLDAWLQSAHPEVEWHSELAQRMAGSETVYRGLTGLRRYWDEWHSLWRVEIDVTEIHEHGDSVVAIGHIRARGGASGVDVESAIAYVFEFDGDRARTVRSYFDTQQALAAAGL